MTIRRVDFPITLVLAGAAVLATVLSAPALVADASAICAGELWRAITGSFVHATTGHLVRDVALLVVVGAAYEAPLGARFGALVLALLVVPPLAVFAADPTITTYYGLSGLTHGLIAAVLVRERCRLVGAAFAAKLAYEALTGAPLFPMELGDGVRQVPIAHLAGALVGALAVSPFRATRIADASS